nr:MAG TPA: hypothetical protein [Caudoviricetes sp.]
MGKINLTNSMGWGALGLRIKEKFSDNDNDNWKLFPRKCTL